MVTIDSLMESEYGLMDSKPVVDTTHVQKANLHNGRVVIIEGVVYKISCPRFKECLGPTYNQGFTKYLCSEQHHELCSTENPNVCKHENFAALGFPAKHYRKQ